MDYYNLITNIENCKLLIDEAPLNLIYYSHLPTAIISLFVGFIVFVKSKNNLAGKLLFALTLSFSLWLLCDLVVWTKANNSIVTMFSWSLLNFLDSLFYIISLYFFYVYARQQDISFGHKLILFLLILPIAVVTPTEYNLSSFNAATCEATSYASYEAYIFLLEILIMVATFFLSIKYYLKTKKREVGLMASGVISFQLLFFSSGYIANILGDYSLEFYGLFGMTIFMALIAYTIVKYQAFNIKLIGAQVLVTILPILIGTQFFFIRNKTNMVLTGITLVLTAIFGYFLIRSIKMEVSRREEVQMMNEKLSQAYEKLRVLDRAKSEFISIASHQLRTPLTAIKGFSSLIMDGSYGDISLTMKDVMEKIYASNERLVQLVEDLLNISRIESGRFSFKFAESNIVPVVAEAAETLQFNAKKKGLYLDFKEPENPVHSFIFDQSKIKEVVSNLIDNAIKYTEKGGVNIRINDLGLTVLIRISDTGIGVKGDELQYIFDKFQRGKDSNDINTSGLGLGLYICEKIVKAHEGRIWAESAGLGRGSQFYIELKKDFNPPRKEVSLQDKSAMSSFKKA